MKRMFIWALLQSVSCLQSSRQQSPTGFLARDLASGRAVLVSRSVPSSRAGGACFGPDCCVHVARDDATGTCELEAACEAADAAMLRHLEVAVICQTGDAFTHHSFGYGDLEPQESVATQVACAACFAPKKSDFAFLRTLRHQKQRGKQAKEEPPAPAPAPDATAAPEAAASTEAPPAEDGPAELDLPTAAVDGLGPAETPEMRQLALRQAVAQAVPACPVGPAGLFTPAASPCCGRPVKLIEVLDDPEACGTADGSPPDVCDATCFLSLQVALAQNETDAEKDDDFCGAYVALARSLTSLLNAVCSRSGGQTCATVLSDTALSASPAIMGALESLGEAPVSDEDADGNATANATEGASPAPAPQLLAETARRLSSSAQVTAVERALGAARALARAATARRAQSLDDALNQLCTPCFEKTAGAGLGVVDAFVAAFDAKVFEEALVLDVLHSLQHHLPFLDVHGNFGAADVHAARDILAVALTGVCSTDEAGKHCLPIVVESVRANASLAVTSSGASACRTRCGKLGAQLALIDAASRGDDAPRAAAIFSASDQLPQLAKGLTLIEGGCQERQNEYCIDQFWAYAEGLTDLQGTVEMMTEGCMTASTGGECGTCAQVLEGLDSFGCCKAAILEGMLLLASRHAALEDWGFVPEGAAKHLGAAGELAAIREGIGQWTKACDRSSWVEPCDTCSEQVALSVAMPEGVTQPELQTHQFAIEEALLKDVALSVRCPRHDVKVLEWAQERGNVSLVFGLQGESCSQAGFAADALRHRVAESAVVFAHVPEAFAEIADPVEEVVEFALEFQNGTDPAKAVSSVKQHLANTLAVDAASLSVEEAPQDGKSVRVAGSVKGSGRVGLAKDLQAKLDDAESPLRKDLGAPLVTSDVRVGIVPNEPTLGIVNRTAHDAFGPAGCVHISRASSGECVLTTRGCDLGALAHFEVAFMCVTAAGDHEKHTYGRGGALGNGVAFDASEAFHTGIKCSECRPPPTEPPGSSWTAVAALGVLALLHA